MPNTWVTPHATMVSTITSDTVRLCSSASGTSTYTPSPRTSTGKRAGASVNPGGGVPVSGS